MGKGNILRHKDKPPPDYDNIAKEPPPDKIRQTVRTFKWWLRRDLNSWHSGYEPNALANWATQPYNGADNQSWTGDLILTKDALYLLSYISTITNWLREEDSNLWPSGYEPDELPTAPSRDDKWWAGMDSNHRSLRRRIYSPFPLTTRAPTHIICQLYSV